MLQQYEMMHNDVSSTKNMSLDQAQSLNVELGLDFDFIPSKKLNQSLDGPLIFTPLKLQFSWPFSKCQARAGLEP